MKATLEYIEGHRQDFVDQLKALLAFPSVSADPAYRQGVRDCAAHVRAKLDAMGLKTELVETPGHPIVYAEHLRAEQARTLLCYGHYDVQPVDPLDLWTHPPFKPHVEGDKLFARGAADDKGQFMTHILAVEAFLKTGRTLPVNLKFLIEGEEETAADNLEGFIRQNRERLKAHGVVVSDTAMYGDGLPAITYGLRGIAVAEIKVTGPAKDLHSGSFGGAVANPATEVARIVASFHGEDRRIQIHGFYDDVRPLEEWERKQFMELPFDEKEFLVAIGAPATVGEEGYTTLERKWGRPTCEVNGIFGGYQGEGSKTVIPSWAGCKVSLRLVPDQDPDQVLERFENHLKAVASPGVKVEVSRLGGARPAIVSRESFLMQAGSEALKMGFGRPPVFIREGGSIPIVNVFKEELGLDTLLLGFARDDCNAHSPNENISLADFHRGIITMAHLFEGLR